MTVVRMHVSGPFVFPARDIVNRPGEMREFVVDAPAPQRWGEGLVSVAQGEPVRLDVRLESVHEGILVTGEASAVYRGICGRCLIDIAQPVEVEFQELFGYPGEEATDFELQNDYVDTGPLVRDTIVLALPFQPVCQPDCPGLDPITGERLTEEAAQEPRESVDPRWATLKTFTNDAVADRRDETTEES
ncbi:MULTISPECIES: DUF177 domain-containing protein [unclassified Microbacterium]|uniref:YceD family protein n=1 Tax=unclassified Microbacterium TaxID=2609290 RepID=UPI00214C59BF|nr:MULTISPECIES: DUF177 domain-containing protein [unclassified Microbacterium]MCR2785399.1 DUF177 domain-containing protein [Microbacterium sp. zg.B96]WIM14571.1 DUF177 domain-containing protein [Microbacterium sp. zg-B96]